MVSDTRWTTRWLSVHQKDLKNIMWVHMSCKLKPHTKPPRSQVERKKTLMPSKPLKFLFLFLWYIIKAVLHAMSDVVAFTWNRRPSECCFCPLQNLLKSGLFLTSFTRQGCLMFQREGDHMLAGCLSEISNHCVMHSSVTNLMWPTNGLMHDLDLSLTSKHTVHTCVISYRNEQQSDRRSLSVGNVHIHTHMLGIDRNWTCCSGNEYLSKKEQMEPRFLSIESVRQRQKELSSV